MVIDVLNKEGEVVDLVAATGGQQGEYMAAVPLKNLYIDKEYQRDQSPKKVQQIVEAGYSVRKAGVLLLNVRENGMVAVMDGGHRREAAMLSGITHHAALVWYGLTVQQESDVWLGCNTNTRMANMVEKHKALMKKGDLKARIITDAVHAAGLVIAPHTGGKDDSKHPNMLVAVSSAYTIYDAEGGDAQTLTYVLSQLHSYWPEDRQAITDDMIHGFFLFQQKYRGQFSEHRMRQQCSKMTVRRFKAEANAVKYTHDHGIRKAIRRYFWVVYNQNLSKNRLPDLFS